MLDECKVGFVGAGGVAMRHARHLAQLKDVRVVAVTDPNAAAAQSFAETTDAAVATDLDELIKTSPDAVYVCVPPHAHGAIEEQLLDAGIAMFVEKPLAMDLPTAERIPATARQAGVVTAVGHHWRYSPAVDLVRDLLAGRPVRLVTGSWIDRVPPVPWWSKRALSGGQIVEQAVHVLDLIRLLCGDVVEVDAYANSAPPATPGADVDGATVAILKLKSGAVGASPPHAVWTGSIWRALNYTPTDCRSRFAKTTSARRRRRESCGAACSPRTPSRPRIALSSTRWSATGRLAAEFWWTTTKPCGLTNWPVP